MEIRENLIEGVVVEFNGKFCRRFMMKMKKKIRENNSVENSREKYIYNFILCVEFNFFCPCYHSIHTESYTQNIKYTAQGEKNINIYIYIYRYIF